MKKYIPLLILPLLAFNAQLFAQGMHVKQYNYTNFINDKKVVTPTLEKLSSQQARQHPEYGILPYNAQCAECTELIDKRTEYTRFYVDPTTPGHTYSQTSHFPLHYKSSANDVWHTIDKRLMPVAGKPGVFAAPNQPIPTGCDINNRLTSLSVNGFEFKFNHNPTMYFVDEGIASTATLPANFNNYTAGNEGIEIKNVWDGIKMQETFSTGLIKASYIIDAPLQLPISKGYMVIEDHFTLPQGYTITEDGGDRVDGKYYRGNYSIRNEKGEALIEYSMPIYIDAIAVGMYGMYSLKQEGTNYTLSMFVPINWLTRKENVYPIVIDPSVSGTVQIGNFTSSGNASAALAFTTMSLGSCDYHMVDTVPGKSTLTDAYVDLEYKLTYRNDCGSPPLSAPFCTFSQVSMEVQLDECNTTTGLLACNPAQAPYTGTCTTDPVLVPGAGRIHINNFNPNYLTCIAPQCPDYILHFTLKDRDSICGDVCDYLCAEGTIWMMTVEGCQLTGNITQDKTQVCAGQPVTFTAHPSCGVPPFHYVWTSDGGNTLDTIYSSATYTIYPQTIGQVTTACIIIDACGIEATTNFLDVNVIASPSADAGPDVTLCSGGTATIGGNPTTNGSSTIQWTGENATAQGYLSAANIPNPTITVPNGTIDTFFYAVRTSNGTCFRTDTMYVYSIATTAIVNAGLDDTICAGGVVNLGGSPTAPTGSTVSWSSTDATALTWLNSTSATNPIATVPANTTGLYYYIASAAVAGCTGTDTVIITSLGKPLANAGTNVNLCQGGTATLGGNPTTNNAASTTWAGSSAAANSWLSSSSAANPTVTIPTDTVASVYYLLTTNDGVCTSTDTIFVSSHANPVVVIDTSGNTNICSNQSVTLNVLGTYTSYLWSNGATTPTISVNQSGIYNVTATDANGCTGISNAVTVSSITVPDIHVYPDTTINFGDSVMLYTDIDLTGTSIDSYIWTPNPLLSCDTCLNPYATPPADSYFGLSVHTLGCLISDSAFIRVLYKDNFYIPNAFTPNGDGNNDEFYIQTQNGVKVILFQVFDRIGEKVHEGNYPWNGYYKGKPCQPGVYVYIFRLGFYDDDRGILRKGSVTLIR